ncbi:hypothetical protein N9I09_02740 [Pontimonas sp.]|nr:FAD-linked oxidase C-terminal domain-containing protein [Pontimonas sp.]MDA8909814.1 hypothetical protein [Pontimonas sp.]
MTLPAGRLVGAFRRDPLLKRKWLRDELGDTRWKLQRNIKEVFDPQGILNPGKVLTP